MIYIIVTTSIFNRIGVQNQDHRDARYKECISTLSSLVDNDPEFKIVIVENNGPRQTYLDDFGHDVVYTTHNSIRYPHKGVNELLDILYVIHKYNINDNDTVIKMTGRYKLLDSTFLNTVKQYHNSYDAFVKFFNVCTFKYLYDDCVLGLFACKCKYIRNFKYECKRSPECEFALNIRQNVSADKLMEIHDLQLECCFADDLRLLRV